MKFKSFGPDEVTMLSRIFFEAGRRDGELIPILSVLLLMKSLTDDRCWLVVLLVMLVLVCVG